VDLLKVAVYLEEPVADGRGGTFVKKTLVSRLRLGLGAKEAGSLAAAGVLFEAEADAHAESDDDDDTPAIFKATARCGRDAAGARELACSHVHVLRSLARGRPRASARARRACARAPAVRLRSRGRAVARSLARRARIPR
jgi:hypothetical protein